jgi:hypothetical protein
LIVEIMPWGAVKALPSEASFRHAYLGEARVPEPF